MQQVPRVAALQPAAPGIPVQQQQPPPQAPAAQQQAPAAQQQSPAAQQQALPAQQQHALQAAQQAPQAAQQAPQAAQQAPQAAQQAPQAAQQAPQAAQQAPPAQQVQGAQQQVVQGQVAGGQNQQAWDIRAEFLALRQQIDRLQGRSVDGIKDEILLLAARPLAAFDHRRAVALLETLANQARMQGHPMAEEYEIILQRVARSPRFKDLLMDLLGSPILKK
eukprot:XP_002598979.1 hypothetical protein BRAFLDRAFT_122459 [Branchiostoma floridae]